MSTPRRRRLLFGGLTAIGGLLFVLAVGELMARAAGYRMPGVYDANGELVVMDPVDASGGPYRGVQGTLYHFDFEVPWKNNRDGFRERERTPKQDGEWRIGVFGDSFAAGYGLEVEDRLTDVWFAGVRSRMPETSLWNLGANNTGVHHQAELLAGVGRAYELDEIILLLYSGNEGRDDLRWESAQDAKKEKEGETRKEEKADASSASAEPRKPRRSGPRTWLRSSRLAMLAWTVVGAQLAQRVSRVDAPQIEALERFTPPATRALDRFAEIVGDRPLTLWYLPSRMEWDDEHWRFMQAEQGLKDDSGRFLLREGIEAWAKKAGVPFIDLTPALLHQPSDRIRFPIDGHYTAQANRRMAELLVQTEGSAARLRR